jgi:hypothetical protein
MALFIAHKGYAPHAGRVTHTLRNATNVGTNGRTCSILFIDKENMKIRHHKESDTWIVVAPVSQNRGSKWNDQANELWESFSRGETGFEFEYQSDTHYKTGEAQEVITMTAKYSEQADWGENFSSIDTDEYETVEQWRVSKKPVTSGGADIAAKVVKIERTQPAEEGDENQTPWTVA